MADYIRERSSGEIIRDSARIYRAHFGTIFALYFPSAFMWRFIYEVLQTTESWPRGRWVFYGLSYLMPFVVGIQLTVVVSQIYLGYELNVKRAFRNPSTLAKAVVTGLLVVLLVFLYPWIMFAVPVVVLEGTWGFKALKRSMELGKHYYTRNFVVFLWPYTIAFLMWLTYALLYLATLSRGWEIVLYAMKDTAYGLITPLAIITTVMLYFDMRIRNEAYDIVSLAEELKK